MSWRAILIDEPPLLFRKSLAERIGLNEAIVVQQLHFCLEHMNYVVYTDSDGTKWMKASLDFWGRQFPFWSEATIKRIFANLRTRQIVKTERGREGNVYTINYATLGAEAQSDPGAESASALAQDDTPPCKREVSKEEQLGAAGGDPSPALPGLEAPPAPSAPPKVDADAEAVKEVWEHHVALFGDRFRVKALTAPRERTIRKALKGVEGDVALLKRASDGLQSYRKSNPSGSQDVSIDVIFATGPHSSRSLTDQVEWWASQAESDGRSAVPGVPSALHPKINRRRLLVVEMYQRPNDTALRESGQQALAWLKEEMKLEPVVTDGQVTGWKSVES